MDALRSGVVAVAYELLYGFVRATVKPFGEKADDVVVDAYGNRVNRSSRVEKGRLHFRFLPFKKTSPQSHMQDSHTPMSAVKRIWGGLWRRSGRDQP